MKRPIIRLCLLSLFVSSLAWSAETAPDALPEAFLNQLPMLLELSDEQIQALLQIPNAAENSTGEDNEK
ncbi:MAG: hypothetical protein Q9O24_02735 [Gammaproteobacteria bacterium]|nr:hypothetical protein [Gammaproteobacteria bacterium]